MLRDANLKGIKGKVRVNEDGSSIYHNDKLINQYTIKSASHSKGYYCCSIENNQFYTHRIVAEAFVQNPKPISYKLVIHKDGDTLNNHFENLLWGNSKTLYQKRVEAGIPGAGVSHIDKKYRGSSSISYDEAIKIAERLDKGETARSIAKEYNVSEMSIIRIRKRYCKKKVASPRYSKDVKSTVLQLLEKYSLKEVAKITGLRYETVRRWEKSVVSKKEDVSL
jgi:transposase